MKTLSERIAARVKTKRSQNRAAFLALRSEIAQAMADGWPIKTIWQTLHEEGKVSFGYEAFINHVKRLIKAPSAASLPPPKAEITNVTPLDKTQRGAKPIKLNASPEDSWLRDF